jgi:PadR family transcriptional regulator, regulatory protein PadR
MILLSRSEEIVLLSIWKHSNNAYGTTIRERASEITGRSWSIGAIYAPLHRLEKKGLLRTRKGVPKPERGGRSRIFYELTRDGKKALVEIKCINEAAWSNIPEIDLKTQR